MLIICMIREGTMVTIKGEGAMIAANELNLCLARTPDPRVKFRELHADEYKSRLEAKGYAVYYPKTDMAIALWDALRSIKEKKAYGT